MRTNGIRNKIANLFVCMTAALLIATPAIAQEQLQTTPKLAPAGTGASSDATDPVLIVTLGSLDKLMQDANYITGAVGQPQLGGLFSMIAGSYAQGMDMNQPIGVLVPLVDGVPQPIAVLPTSDIKSILKRLEAQTGGPADELDDGTMVISIGANTIFIQQKGAWAALAPRKELLEFAPMDPTSLFEGMGNDYDIAIRLKVQQVPLETRNMLVSQMRQGFEQAMQKQEGADAEQTREMADSSMKQLEQFINDTDELNLGLNIDKTEQLVAIDSSFTAVDGSKLASLYSGAHAIPSQFASVIRSDAAAYYHAATSIGPEAIEQTRKTLKSSMNSLSGMLESQDNLTPGQADDIKILIDQIVELSMKSISEGRADMGALLLTAEDSFQFVFGAFVADGDEAAQIAKDVAAKLENEPDAPRFEFDRSTYNGVTMHLVEADVPESEDEARKVFGEKLQVHIGTGEKSVYVAIGKESESLMKQLIDNSDSDKSADRPIGQFNLKLKPILEFAQSIESNEGIAAMIEELARGNADGVMTMVQDSIENGQATKITISEGLLKAVGAAAQKAQAANMQGQF
ncbi:hypothetical protein [Rubripirellula obstinata]|nr:hypothetical protein [Rubripirellula obstinata]